MLPGLADGAKASSFVRLRWVKASLILCDLKGGAVYERDDETHWALSSGSERYALGPRKPVNRPLISSKQIHASINTARQLIVRSF